VPKERKVKRIKKKKKKEGKNDKIRFDSRGCGSFRRLRHFGDAPPIRSRRASSLPKGGRKRARYGPFARRRAITIRANRTANQTFSQRSRCRKFAERPYYRLAVLAISRVTVRRSRGIPRRVALADGLQGRGLGARVLRDAVAHAGHPVAGCAVPITLATRVGLRVPAEESLERSPDLWLAADRCEDQDSLEGVYQVGEVPDVLGTTDRPRYHVGHPGNAHHDHELHADAA